MKTAKFYNLLAIGLALTCIVATGCKRKPNYITPIPGRTGTAVQEPPPGGILPGGTGPASPITGTTTPSGIGSATTGFPPGAGHSGWTEDADMFKADTVYFDFDTSAIKDSEKSKIDSVASYLKSNPASAVKVEGHCDERGTEEYNRALGERRALAVRELLIAQGIVPDRVDTISYGKDRPADPGHNPAAWSKNRRGAFILLTPPK